MMAKKPAKKVLHVQSFCFANFLIPVVVVIALSLHASSVTTLNNS